MNRFTLGSMALASALLAPAVSHAQSSCTREGLTAAADLSIAAQARGYKRPSQGHITGSDVLVDLPVGHRMSYVENFDTSPRSPLLGKPLKIDRHISLLDTARCEIYTEGLVSNKADPYALGTRLRLRNNAVAEIETMWSAPGYRGFDIDGYLKNSSAEDWGAIPEARRDTRATLESAANAYLDALLAGKASVMPWGFPCNRPLVPEEALTADGSCQVGVPAGTVNIENRHFVVDETMGAVAVLCTFGVDPASGRIRTPDAHLFRIENGKVRFVHALTHLLDAADGGQAK
jgi:hypothetical protein